MNEGGNQRRANAMATALCLMVSVGCAGGPSLDTSQPKSFDGLLPVKSTTMDQVWVREGFDLTGHSQLVLQGYEVEYRPARRSGTETVARSEASFPMDERQKDRLEEIFHDAFKKALHDLDRYEIIDSRTPGALLLRVKLIDVVSRIPPARFAGGEYYIDSVGEATLVVEFVDAESDTVLLRGTDTRVARPNGRLMMESSPALNANEVRKVAKFWADMLVEGLNEVTSFEAELGASS